MEGFDDGAELVDRAGMIGGGLWRLEEGPEDGLAVEAYTEHRAATAKPGDAEICAFGGDGEIGRDAAGKVEEGPAQSMGFLLRTLFIFSCLIGLPMEMNPMIRLLIWLTQSWIGIIHLHDMVVICKEYNNI